MARGNYSWRVLIMCHGQKKGETEALEWQKRLGIRAQQCTNNTRDEYYLVSSVLQLKFLCLSPHLFIPCESAPESFSTKNVILVALTTGLCVGFVFPLLSTPQAYVCRQCDELLY